MLRIKKGTERNFRTIEYPFTAAFFPTTASALRRCRSLFPPAAALIVIAAMGLFGFTGCGTTTFNRGRVIGKAFQVVEVIVEPDSIGPDEEMMVTVEMVVLSQSHQIQGLAVNLDYRPPLVPVRDKIEVLVDGVSLAETAFRTELEGGRTLTLRIIMDDPIALVDDRITVKIPFYASSMAMAPIKRSVPIDVDIKVGGAMAPEIGHAEVEVVPVSFD